MTDALHLLFQRISEEPRDYIQSVTLDACPPELTVRVTDHTLTPEQLCDDYALTPTLPDICIVYSKQLASSVPVESVPLEAILRAFHTLAFNGNSELLNISITSARHLKVTTTEQHVTAEYLQHQYNIDPCIPIHIEYELVHPPPTQCTLL